MLLRTLLILIVSLSLNAQDLKTEIAKGDSLVKEFKMKEALNVYLQADKSSENNWETKWRISRALVDIGEHMSAETGDEEDAQLAKFEEALAYAEKSVELEPGRSITYLRRAIANGKIALFKGVFSVAGVVEQVKNDCEKAIELNNCGDKDQAVAHYVLARTHAKISEKWAPARSVLGLGWADNEIALEHFEKAVQLYPEFIMIRVDYARSLMREDKYKEAKEQLETALNSPILDEDDQVRLAEAKELLVEVEEEL